MIQQDQEQTFLFTNYLVPDGDFKRNYTKKPKRVYVNFPEKLILTPSTVEPLYSYVFRNKFLKDPKELYHVLDRVEMSIDRNGIKFPCNIVMMAGSSNNQVVMVEKSQPKEDEIPYMLFVWNCLSNNVPEFKRLMDMETFIQKDYQMVDGKQFNTIVQIVCFDSNIVYLTHDGRVFSDWNSFTTKKIKNKHGNIIGSVLDIDNSLFHAEKIASGSDHVLILIRERLTGKRKVLGFGGSYANQLGVKESLVKSLREISILPKSSKDQVVDIKCGNKFSVFLTLHGYLYVCGDNTYQQTGKKKEYICIMDVMKVTLKEFDYNVEKVKEVCCGEYFTVVITSKGRVFSTIQNIGVRKLPKREEIGFYELDYFSKENITVRHVYIASDSIILQSKNQLYHYGVKYEQSYSLIGRISITNEIPKPILFDSLKQYAPHVYSSNTSPYIFVKRTGLSSNIIDFHEKLLHTTRHNKLSDLIIK